MDILTRFFFFSLVALFEDISEGGGGGGGGIQESMKFDTMILIFYLFAPFFAPTPPRQTIYDTIPCIYVRSLIFGLWSWSCGLISSIPYTSGTMVRNHVVGMIGLEGFDAIVKEKVDEDGVDFCVGVLSDDFSPDELNGPDAGSCFIANCKNWVVG